MAAPEYDAFEAQARREVDRHQVAVQAAQQQAQRLLTAGEGDVSAGAPSGE